VATGYYPKVITLLQSTGDARGDWFQIGLLLSVSCTITGLEAGGNISVEVLNSDPEVRPANEVDGAPHKSLGNVTQNAADMIGSYTWIRAKKTAGSGATETTVSIQSQIPK